MGYVSGRSVFLHFEDMEFNGYNEDGETFLIFAMNRQNLKLEKTGLRRTFFCWCQAWSYFNFEFCSTIRL